MRDRRLLIVPLLLVVGAASALVAAPQTRARSGVRPATLTQDALFEPAKVWTAHFRFTANEWAAIQPTRGRGRGSSSDADWLQGAEGERNGWGVVNGIDFEYVHANLEFAGTSFENVAVRFKGNGTFLNGRGSGKISLKVDLNKYVEGQKLAGLSTINFHNVVTDAGFMNEALAYRLYRDGGTPAPRTSYARVFITVGGQPRKAYGLYSVVENVDTNFIHARLGRRDGAILKPSTRDPFVNRGVDWARYNQTYDPKTDLTEAERQRIIEFCRFVSQASSAEFAARIGTYVDLEAFARYMAVLVWLSNPDSILDRGQNYYVYLHPGTKRLQFIPWDQDHSFGNFGRMPQGGYERADIYTPWIRTVTFLNRMNAVPAIRNAYLARMREFSTTIFASSRFAAQIAALAPVLRPALEDERGRLREFDRAVAGQTGILPFATARTRSVIDQLATSATRR